jgi:hypothetical protein
MDQDDEMWNKDVEATQNAKDTGQDGDSANGRGIVQFNVFKSRLIHIHSLLREYTSIYHN